LRRESRSALSIVSFIVGAGPSGQRLRARAD
jgi:hypothetical protein